MIKKALPLVLCIAMIVNLAACTGQTPTSGTSSTGASTSTGNQTEKVSLKVTSWRTDDLAAWNAINAEFTKKYPNITATFEPVTATEYDGVLLTSLKSGNAADVIFLRAWGSGRQLYDAGYVIDLTEKDIPNLAQLPAATKAVWANDKGVSYGVPGSVCYGGFFYNKGIFTKCGVTEPKTWADFMSICEKIKAKGYTAIGFGIKDSWMVAEYLSSTVIPATSGGSAWHDKLMNKEVNFLDAAYVKHFAYIKQMAQYFPKGFEGIGYTDMQQLFLSEASAIYPVGTFDLGYLQSTNPNIDLGFFYMPRDNASDKLSINFGAIMGYGINSKIDASKLASAKTYLNWLADIDASKMFSNAILGQYACNPGATDLKNAVSKSCLEKTIGADLFKQMPYQKLSDKSPDYTTAVSEAIYKLLVNNATPEEAAQMVQNSLSWYFK